MIWKPNVTVAAVVERQGRFLIVEEDADGKRVYNQPAGHLDENESLVEAVIRETLEETAWRFEPTALVGVYRWKNIHTGITYLRICFTGVCHDEEAGRPLDQGIVQAVWLKRDELTALGTQLRSPLVLRCIDDYLAGQHYPLSLLMDVQ
ncbi:MAG: NUDIX hydrolase [Gammaproteobacteria bacterium]